MKLTRELVLELEIESRKLLHGFKNDEIARGILSALIRVVIEGLMTLWFYSEALRKRDEESSKV